MLSLAILLLAVASASTTTPPAEDASLKILSAPAAVQQESKIVQAADAANAARSGREAKVSIDAGTLRRTAPADHSTAIAPTSTTAPQLTVDRTKPDPLAMLQAALANSRDVKMIKAPGAPEPTSDAKQ